MANLKPFTHFIVNSLAFGALLFLAGCQTLPPVSDLKPITVSDVRQAQGFELQGKLAIKTPEDKLSANLYWWHSKTRDELTLTTMLGTSILTLSATPEGATLKIDGKEFRDSDAEALLKRVSGWSIPLSALPLWVTGQVGVNDTLEQSNADGTPLLVSNSQHPPVWLIKFLSWQQQSGARVPRQLTLERGDLQLKLQLNQWQALGNTKTALEGKSDAPKS